MIEARFYVDSEGNYLGSYSGAEPPDGSVEVSEPPYDARQVWLDGGWGDVPQSVPQTVSKRQAKLALLNEGLLDDVEAFIESLDRVEQIEWADSGSFDRSSPLISKVGDALSISQKRLDALFRAAGNM